jgi:hypothetical protein
MRSSILVALLPIAACSPLAVSPPARTHVMTSPLEPANGQDVQVDVARIGNLIWGPELASANARLRRNVEPGLVVEADAGLLHVTNAGDGGSRNGYTGRLGLVRHYDERLAIGAGAGAGHSDAAGNWGSVDIGGVVSGKHRYVRPVLGGTLGYSRPIGQRRTFTVSEPEGAETTLRLPSNRFAQVNVGIELGPRDQALVLGGSLMKFWLDEVSQVPATEYSTREELFVTLGIGVRFATE